MIPAMNGGFQIYKLSISLSGPDASIHLASGRLPLGIDIRWLDRTTILGKSLASYC